MLYVKYLPLKEYVNYIPPKNYNKKLWQGSESMNIKTVFI